jgi:microcystin-dependent protein
MGKSGMRLLIALVVIAYVTTFSYGGCGKSSKGGSSSIGPGAVNSTMIADGVISNADISDSAAISYSKLAGVASSNHNHDTDYSPIGHTHNYDSLYVNEEQADSVTSAMITNGTIVGSDIASDGSVVKSLVAGANITVANNNDGSWAITATANAPTGMVPVGCMIAYLKSFPNTPALPSNFVECNGQVLSDADSPYNGQTIPDLNGSGGIQRFLRGSTTSGTTGGEDTHVLTATEMPSHSHSYNMPAGSETHGTGGQSMYYTYSGTSTGNAGGDQAHENRPPYYEVVWIIRIK